MRRREQVPVKIESNKIDIYMKKSSKKATLSIIIIIGKIIKHYKHTWNPQEAF